MELGKPFTKDEKRDWGLTHGRCELCGIPWQLAMRERFPEYLQTHHIVGGPNRKDYPWNFLRLCSRCHRHYHDGGESSAEQKLPEIDLGVLLEAKHRATPDEWRPELLKALRGRSIPDRKPIPELLLAEQSHYGFFPKGAKHDRREQGDYRRDD